MLIGYVKSRMLLKISSMWYFSAVFSNNRRLATMSELLDKIPDVEIDDSGRFKYVLIEVEDKANVESKVIVRGTLTNWHCELFR